MLNVDYEHCTACEACAQRCPKQCISMVGGEFDFLYPQVDLNNCIDCHLCEKVCPIQAERAHPVQQRAYAAVHKDTSILKSSTSGGACSALANVVIMHNGIIYGVEMDNDFVVHHIRVSSSSDLSKLRGSKYLQSRVGTAFQDAEQDLKNGKQVLFSGTPCQIDGLKHFLGKEYENLVTVDIVCHGVGSQAYFNKFLTTLTAKWPETKGLLFRSKTFAGWSCASGSVLLNDQNGKEVEKPFYSHENYYYQFFLQGDIYRRSCYTCKYANLDRPGDLTLGDFWGVEKLKLSLNTYDGCSLLICNTEKGRQLLERVNDLQLEEVPVDKAIQQNGQLQHPSLLRAKRAQRLIDYETKTGSEIAASYYRLEKKSVLKGAIKKMIPYSMKALARRWLR